MRTITRTVASIAALGVLAAASAQESYPTKPVRVIVPYVAGGAADIFGRTLAQKLGDALKQPFVVENRGGANGGIGSDVVAKSAPDGYTLLATASGPITVNPILYAKVPYDPVKDFAPIAQCTVYQYVLVTLTSSPFKSISEIVAAARARPGTLSYGSTGVGGGNHLAGELFALATGTSVPQIRAGKLRAFAVSSAKRASSLPEVPTLDEAGIKGFDISQWQGFLAPAGTPNAIVARLNAEIVKALQLPDVRDRLATRGGNEIVSGTPDDLAALIRSDLQKYAKLIKDAHIPAQ
jgi:tripartite-type tricarboxylate transporter receptor subunit TctC